MVDSVPQVFRVLTDFLCTVDIERGFIEDFFLNVLFPPISVGLSSYDFFCFKGRSTFLFSWHSVHKNVVR